MLIVSWESLVTAILFALCLAVGASTTGTVTAHSEAAVVDPGPGTTRDSVGRNATTVGVTDLGVTIETPGNAGANAPWNNVCAPLYDGEG